MGRRHCRYASLSRQTLFLYPVNVFSGPCYPEAYDCSVRGAGARLSCFPYRRQPDKRSRAAQDTDAMAMEDSVVKSTLRTVQTIRAWASVRALGRSLATTNMITNDSYSTS